MSPILELQYKLRELGRIRMGMKGERGAPKKLDTWRLTSASDDLLKSASDVYGGTVEPWDDAPGGPQFQLLTESDSLDIIIPPGEASLTQWMEMWSGGGCKKRCDGKRQMLRDVECSCPSDPEERRTQAALGKACKETTRFNVMLPKVPDLGVWRLETHGYYAARELAGIIQLLTAGNAGMVAARLRLDQRAIRRPGEKTKRFIVPVVGLPDRLDNLLDALGIEAGAVALPSPVERKSLPGSPELSTAAHVPDSSDEVPERVSKCVAAYGQDDTLEAVNLARAEFGKAPVESLQDVAWEKVPDDFIESIEKILSATDWASAPAASGDSW